MNKSSMEFLVIGMRRFQLPDPSKMVHGGKPQAEKLGILLDQPEPHPHEVPVSLEIQPDLPIIRIDYYHDTVGLTSRNDMSLSIRHSGNGENILGIRWLQVDRSAFTAVWAMATIYWEIGKTAFSTHVEAMKQISALVPRNITLCQLPDQNELVMPVWQLRNGYGGFIDLIVASMLEENEVDRDTSLAMAHYALLRILESRFQEKTKEQLGTGEAAKRIVSASGFMRSK